MSETVHEVRGNGACREETLTEAAYRAGHVRSTEYGCAEDEDEDDERCPQYWDRHENQCALVAYHDGRCAYDMQIDDRDEAASARRANALSDACGALKSENTALLAENARLRRRGRRELTAERLRVCIQDYREAERMFVQKAQMERDYLLSVFPDALKPPNAAQVRKRGAYEMATRGFAGGWQSLRSMAKQHWS